MQNDYRSTDDPQHPWNRWLAQQQDKERQQRARVRVWMIVLLVIVTNLSTYFIITQKPLSTLLRQRSQGWVAAPTAIIYSAPNSRSIPRGNASQGTQFDILEMRTNENGWWVHGQFRKWYVFSDIDGWMRVEDITEEDRFGKVRTTP